MAKRKMPNAEALLFNERNPIGTVVRVWPMRAGVGPSFESATTTKAWVLGGHTAVVKVEGRAGCFALSHIDVMDRWPAPPPMSLDELPEIG